MGKFYLEKYPVVSSEGNIYKAIVDESFAYDHIVIILLKKRKFLRIFNWFEEVYRESYVESVHAYNYEEMVRSTIDHYEKLLAEKTNGYCSRKEGVAKFKNWNGRD